MKSKTAPASVGPEAPKHLAAGTGSGAALAAVLARELEATAALEDRLALVAERVPGRIAFSTSLGIEDQAVLHAIAARDLPFDIFTLDTGRHFPETLETLEASIQRYLRPIRVVVPDAAEVEELVARDGIMGFRYAVENRKSCCDVRKVRPLRRALAGAAGWITGLRREQSLERAAAPFAAWDAEHGLIKVSPIADWSLADVEAYVARHDIPVNPLHAKGFPSIGCQPCTRAIRPGEDLRAGRWWWENEEGKECGLHNRPKQKDVAA